MDEAWRATYFNVIVYSMSSTGTPSGAGADADLLLSNSQRAFLWSLDEIGLRPLATVCGGDGSVDIAFDTVCGRGLLLRCSPFVGERAKRQLVTILEQGPFLDGYSISHTGQVTDRWGNSSTAEDIIGAIRGRQR